MEYNTVKQNEKKISVKICNGKIWERIRGKLEKTEKEDKKGKCPKSLVLDVTIKRAFRSPDSKRVNAIADQQCGECGGVRYGSGLLNRIKSVLKGKSQYCPQEVQNSRSKEQKKKSISYINKSKKNSRDENDIELDDSQEKHPKSTKIKSKKSLKNNCLNSQRESRQNKRPVKPKCKAVCPDDLDAESEDELSPNYVKHVNGPSDNVVMRVGTTAEKNNGFKWTLKEYFDRDARSGPEQVARNHGDNAPSASTTNKAVNNFQRSGSTQKCLKKHRSSLISLKVVDLNKKKKRNEQKIKDDQNKLDLKGINGSARELDPIKIGAEKDNNPIQEDLNLQVLNAEINLDNPFTDSQRRSKEDEQFHSNKRTRRNGEKRQGKGGMSLDKSSVKLKCVQSAKLLPELNSRSNKSQIANESTAEINSPKNVGKLGLSQEYLSSSSSGTSSSERLCTCGCMESTIDVYDNYNSDSSDSSCSSVEYLRSYSGNLIMCANGKKPLLSDHIRYLKSYEELLSSSN